MPFLEHTKHLDNFMATLLAKPERYRPVIELLDNIVLNLAELTWAEAELISAEICKTNKSEFCTGIHNGVARALNADQGMLDNAKLQPILDFSRKLNHDASSIGEQDIQSVRDAGWNDQTLEDVIGLVATIRIYNTLANGLGFKGLPEPAFTQMGEATVAQNGFLPLFQSFMADKTDQAPEG